MNTTKSSKDISAAITTLAKMKEFRSFLSTALKGYKDPQDRKYLQEILVTAQLLMDFYLNGMGDIQERPKSVKSTNERKKPKKRAYKITPNNRLLEEES